LNLEHFLSENRFPLFGKCSAQDQFGEALRVVLLQEVAAVQGRVRLALGSGHPAQELRVAAAGDGITVAEAGDEGLLPALEYLPGGAVGRHGRVLRIKRHEGGEDTRPGLVGGVREGLRELGDLLIKTGDKASAKGAFADYLVRAPNAEDRWLVEDALKTL
jgi:hypothetical protein